MKSLSKSFVLFTVILLFIFTSSVIADEKSDQVDKLFTQWDQPDSPGCALAIIQDGKIIHKKGYGMANLELGVPITPGSVFYIGSCSKQFVTMCIALLAQEGKLSIDDDVRKHIPELPDYGNPITIRHLIHHTSGLRDYLELLGIAGIDFGTYHQDDALGLIARQKELNFKPGEKYLYSNSGYLTLAVIVARASGKSLHEFADEKFFKPLGMKNSHFHDDYTTLIKNRATGYFSAGKDKYKNFISTFDCVGSGGLFSTVEDLFLWDQNFFHHNVGGKDLIEGMHTQGILNNGEKLDYAFALTISEYKGLKTVGHGGSLGGYRAGMVRFPEQKFSVICLSNLSAFNPTRIWQQIADIYLVDRFKTVAQPSEEEKQAKAPESTKLSTELLKYKAEQLREYQGDYSSKELGVTFNLELKQGKLYFTQRNAPESPLLPTIQDKFTLNRLRLSFIRDEENVIIAFTMDSGRVKHLRFNRVGISP